jgi:phosphatidylserine synthase
LPIADFQLPILELKIGNRQSAIILVLLFGVITLARADANVSSCRHSHRDFSKLPCCCAGISVVLKQILPAQLRRNLTENSFQIHI